MSRKPRVHQDAKMQTFGASTRHSSQERVTVNGIRKTRKTSNNNPRPPSNERAYSNNPTKPAAKGWDASFSLNNSAINTNEKPNAHALTSPHSNITSHMKPHLDKAAHLNDQINSQYRTDYIQAATMVQEQKGTIKGLKSQIKSLNGECKALKQENSGKTLTIEKLEKTCDKLKNDQTNQQLILDLQNEMKRKDMKLRKMKERRNIYRDEKEGLQQMVTEANEKTASLLDQVTQMQDSSHAIRQENARLQHQLQRADGDMNQLQGEVNEFQEQVVSMRDSSKAVEQELIDRLRRTEEKNKELIQIKLNVVE